MYIHAKMRKLCPCNTEFGPMRVFTASQTLKADWMLPSVLSSAAESHVSLCSGQVTDLAVVKYRVSLPCETRGCPLKNALAHYPLHHGNGAS